MPTTSDIIAGIIVYGGFIALGILSIIEEQYIFGSIILLVTTNRIAHKMFEWPECEADVLTRAMAITMICMLGIYKSIQLAEYIIFTV